MKTNHSTFTQVSISLQLTKVFLFSFLISMAFNGQTIAQVINWDGGGGIDNNWTTALNWDTDALPTASSEVVIDGATFNVVIPANANITVQDIDVRTNASLTIAANATLNIANSAVIGVNIVGATLTNHGTLNAQTNIGTTGIVISGLTAVLENNGVININNTGLNGIAILSNGTLDNNSHLNIGPTITRDGIRMFDNSTVNNAANAELNILGVGAGEDGISDGGSGQTVENAGTICINDVTGGGGENIGIGITYNQTGAGTLTTSGCVATFPANSPDVPTLSEWGLIVLALCLMIFGVLSLLPENKVKLE